MHNLILIKYLDLTHSLQKVERMEDTVKIYQIISECGIFYKATGLNSSISFKKKVVGVEGWQKTLLDQENKMTITSPTWSMVEPGFKNKSTPKNDIPGTMGEIWVCVT